MTNLTPNPGWDNVVQLETDTAALGGPGGPMNSQAQSLLNRTEYLKAGGFDDGTVTDAKLSGSNSVLDAIVSKLRFLAAGVGAVYRSLRDKLRESVSVLDYGADPTGATESTGAFNNAVAAAVTTKRKLYIPGGSYLLANWSVPSFLTVEGDGKGTTILLQKSGAEALAFTAPTASSSVSDNVRNVIFRNMTMQGTVTTDGFQEVLHLFFTQGVTNLLLEDVEFRGWRGDGVYIGTGNERGQNPSQIRHNRNVTIRRCTFDGQADGGATIANRNAVSLIDCEGALIEDNYFTACSQAGMPGCIDIEPDGGGTPAGSAAILRNITIRSNTFKDNFGEAIIAMNFPNGLAAQTTAPYGFRIEDNLMDGGAYNYTVGVSLLGWAAITDAVTPIACLVRGNTVRNMHSPLAIYGVAGVRVEENQFQETRYSAYIGKPDGAIDARDVLIHGNTFLKVAQDNTAGGNGFFLYGSVRCRFRLNTFKDCGKANNTYNANIVIAAGGNYELYIQDNTFYSSSANSNAWDVRFDGGVLSNFRHTDNHLINVNGGTSNCANDYMTRSDWKAITLQGWVAYGSNRASPEYCKDSTGRVWLRGSIKNGSTGSGSSIASFPAGFRPGSIIEFPVHTSSGIGSVQIEQSIGDMQVISLPTNALVSLNGISWKAEA